MATAQSFRSIEADDSLRWSMQSPRKGPRHLVLKGVLNVEVASQASEVLDLALTGLRNRDLIIDLTGLDFMDHTGVHLLMEAARRMREVDGMMRIRVPSSGAVRRTLDVLALGTGLDRILEVP